MKVIQHPGPLTRLRMANEAATAQACAPWFEFQVGEPPAQGFARNRTKVRAPKGARASRAVRPLVWYVGGYDGCGPWFQVDQSWGA